MAPEDFQNLLNKTEYFACKLVKEIKENLVITNEEQILLSQDNFGMTIEKAIHRALGTMIENETKSDPFKDTTTNSKDDELVIGDTENGFSDSNCSTKESSANGEVLKNGKGEEKGETEPKTRDISDEIDDFIRSDDENKSEDKPAQNGIGKPETVKSSKHEEKLKESGKEDKDEPMEVSSSQNETPKQDVSKPENLEDKSEDKVSENSNKTHENHSKEEKSEKKGAICLEPVGQTDSDSDTEEDSKKDENPTKPNTQTNSASVPDSTTKPEEEKDVNYKDALEELTKISNNSRSINEEDSQKRQTSKCKLFYQKRI